MNPSPLTFEPSVFTGDAVAASSCPTITVHEVTSRLDAVELAVHELAVRTAGEHSEDYAVGEADCELGRPVEPRGASVVYDWNDPRLKASDRSVIAKLQKLYDIDISDISPIWIKGICPTEFRVQSGVGHTYQLRLESLQAKLHAGFVPQEKASGANTLPVGAEGGQQSPSLDVSNLSFSCIDILLVEDFERFLLQLDRRARTIAIARWAYNEPMRNLAELGTEFSITRERVRQIARDCELVLPQSLRIAPEQLWILLQAQLSNELTEVLPTLAECFLDRRQFYRFLEVCCEAPKEAISESQWLGDANLSILDAFFAETPAPVSVEACVDELTSGYGMSDVRALRLLERMQAAGNLSKSPEGANPRQLIKEMAIAHVLCTHPHGLPWKDIVRIVNHSKICRVKFSDQRRDYVFSLCDLVYLCDNGCYRHTMFLKLTGKLVRATLAAVRGYLDSHESVSENLQTVHLALRSAIEIDYYTLRHIVASMGEEVGLYFVGKSRVDTVGLSKDPQGVNAPEVIMRLLSRSPGPLTVSEIAQQLRSKSYPFAAHHLFLLEEAGKVVRLDRSFFAPADNALQGIDTKSIGDAIDRILESSAVPVEADVFRERIATSDDLRKSKYFYASLARMLAKDYGWHCRRLLFSKNPIRHSSLRSLVQERFNPDRTNQEIIADVRREVLISDHMATGMVRSWLSAERSSSQLTAAIEPYAD